MINLMYVLITLFIVLINLLALGILAERVVPDRNYARFSAIIGITLLLFFIEHFIGLGHLSWLWPLSTFLSAFFLWRIRNELVFYSFWEPEIAFIVAFLYAFVWRFLMPDIDTVAENMTDLYFISNYRQGTTLPPGDMWLSGFSFDFYYSFLHYSIALFSRVFDLGIGMGYNLAWSLVYGLMGGLAWSIGSALDLPHRYKALVSAVICLGGSGVTIFSLVIWKFYGETNGRSFFDSGTAADYLTASVRAIGGSADRANTRIGEFFFPGSSSVPVSETTNLPIETPAYLLFNGDLHPPLGSFLLLLFTVAGMLWYTKTTSLLKKSVIASLVISSVPLSLATNAWIFPLQGLLVFVWLMQQKINPRSLIKPVLFGGGITTCLLFPFLLYFSDSSLSLPVKTIPFTATTPVSIWLQWWPLLFAVPLSALVDRKFQTALTLVITITLALFFTLYFYFDDYLGGSFERFNTTLKWWSWSSMALILVIAFGLTEKRLRLVSTLILLSYLSYLPFSLIYLGYSDHSNSGKLQGHNWFTGDASNRDLLKYMKTLPRGIVLESPETGAYSRTTRFSLFSEQPAFIGWYSHQLGWRGQPNFINMRVDKVKKLYDGKLTDTDALDFVIGNQVRYVLWTPEDVQQRPQHWKTVHEQLKPDYEWIAFYDAGIHKVGLWQRIKHTSFSENKHDNKGS